MSEIIYRIEILKKKSWEGNLIFSKIEKFGIRDFPMFKKKMTGTRSDYRDSSGPFCESLKKRKKYLWPDFNQNFFKSSKALIVSPSSGSWTSENWTCIKIAA